MGKRLVHAMIPGVMEGIILCDRLFVISRSLAFNVYAFIPLDRFVSTYYRKEVRE